MNIIEISSSSNSDDSLSDDDCIITKISDSFNEKSINNQKNKSKISSSCWSQGESSYSSSSSSSDQPSHHIKSYKKR